MTCEHHSMVASLRFTGLKHVCNLCATLNCRFIICNASFHRYKCLVPAAIDLMTKFNGILDLQQLLALLSPSAAT
jgi:hypothetical protein